MAHVAAHGYPVPEVYDVTATDMVLERLTGTALLAVFARQPWRAG
ncbi:hypothetical protein [Streptomyces noursei]